MENTEKKQIVIEIINNDDNTRQMSFKMEGLSNIEVLGLLRLYEQRMSLELLKDFKGTY